MRTMTTEIHRNFHQRSKPGNEARRLSFSCSLRFRQKFQSPTVISESFSRRKN